MKLLAEGEQVFLLVAPCIVKPLEYVTDIFTSSLGKLVCLDHEFPISEQFLVVCGVIVLGSAHDGFRFNLLEATVR